MFNFQCRSQNAAIHSHFLRFQVAGSKGLSCTLYLALKLIPTTASATYDRVSIILIATTNDTRNTGKSGSGDMHLIPIRSAAVSQIPRPLVVSENIS